MLLTWRLSYLNSVPRNSRSVILGSDLSGSMVKTKVRIAASKVVNAKLAPTMVESCSLSGHTQVNRAAAKNTLGMYMNTNANQTHCRLVLGIYLLLVPLEITLA